jgi:ribosome modulation factor
MKRQKRDMNERAFQKGYQAGLAGKSKDLCPYETGEAHHRWLSGWREGRVDNWDGLQGISSLGRQAS